MWIFFGVAVGVVHAVHNGISPRIQKRRTLRNKGYQVEIAFPEFRHCKHFVGCIAVQKECLAEQGNEPVQKNESE